MRTTDDNKEMLAEELLAVPLHTTYVVVAVSAVGN